MNEFFNFHDSWIIVEQNWIWLAAAFAIGAFVGFTFNTSKPTQQ